MFLLGAEMTETLGRHNCFELNMTSPARGETERAPTNAQRAVRFLVEQAGFGPAQKQVEAESHCARSVNVWLH
jgi:hypothetical protein